MKKEVKINKGGKGLRREGICPRKEGFIISFFFRMDGRMDGFSLFNQIGKWIEKRYLVFFKVLQIGNDIIEKDRVEIYECKYTGEKMDQCLCRTKNDYTHTL